MTDLWQKKLLLTGRPGSGKTTAVQRALVLIASQGNIITAGFVTNEIRDGHGQRVGFRLASPRGESRIMAHVDFISQQRVGRYGIDVENIHYMTDLYLGPTAKPDLFVIDEIGKMELFSDRFLAASKRILAGEIPLLGTIPVTGRMIDAVRRRADVSVAKVTNGNRDQLPSKIASWAGTVCDTVAPSGCP